MRLTVALSILLQSLPENVDSKGLSYRSAKQRSLLLGAKPLQHISRPSKSSTGEVGSGGVLVNKKPKLPHECQPGVDVGILSCGTGYYCLESDESDLGGFCIQEEQSFVSSNRHLQNLDNGICLDSGVMPSEDDLNCDCSNLDETGAGVVEDCVIYDNICFALEENPRGGSELCAKVTVDAVYTAEVGLEKFTYCNDFRTDSIPPYTGTYCRGYTFDVNGTETSCEVSVNEEQCGCTFVECPPNGEKRSTFDCTNTRIGTMGSGCDDGSAFLILNYFSDDTDPPIPIDATAPPSKAPITETPTKMPSAETEAPSMGPGTEAPNAMPPDTEGPTSEETTPMPTSKAPITETPTKFPSVGTEVPSMGPVTDAPNAMPPDTEGPTSEETTPVPVSPPPAQAPATAPPQVPLASATSSTSVLWSSAVAAAVVLWAHVSG